MMYMISKKDRPEEVNWRKQKSSPFKNLLVSNMSTLIPYPRRRFFPSYWRKTAGFVSWVSFKVAPSTSIWYWKRIGAKEVNWRKQKSSPFKVFVCRANLNYWIRIEYLANECHLAVLPLKINQIYWRSQKRLQKYIIEVGHFYHSNASAQIN